MASSFLPSLDPSHPLNDKQKERYGFYYLILQQYTGVSDYTLLTEYITDQEFNSTFFSQKTPDEGIDAVYIDEENHKVLIFNFKYRESFNVDKQQSKNEALASSKFFSMISNENNTLPQGKLKDALDDIIECNNGNDMWTTEFFIVSNENVTLDENDSDLYNFGKLYGCRICTVALNEIKEFTSNEPNDINATMIVSKENVMSYKENSLTSDVSYIVHLPLTELVRITADDPSLRNKYNIEDESLLASANIDMHVLYDNVRGLIERSTFNLNIEKTLDKNPEKFFFYNNGITIVADEIKAEEVNSHKKLKLVLSNFQVLNGGQTLRTIHAYNKKSKNNITEKLANAEVLVRMLNVTDDNIKNNIGEYTNSQNSIDLMDLRSVRDEQKQLEHLFALNNILYQRKNGNTGEDGKEYKDSLNMTMLGQLLLAKAGYPEFISNKKKEIFNKYYNKLFTENESLISDDTINLFKRYREIAKSFKSLGISMTPQRCMYVLYLSYFKKRKDYATIVKEIESFATKYKEENKLDRAVSRVFIYAPFKKALDKHYDISEKDLMDLG
jgi:hypothetical protein